MCDIPHTLFSLAVLTYTQLLSVPHTLIPPCHHACFLSSGGLTLFSSSFLLVSQDLAPAPPSLILCHSQETSIGQEPTFTLLCVPSIYPIVLRWGMLYQCSSYDLYPLATKKCLKTTWEILDIFRIPYIIIHLRLLKVWKNFGYLLVI